MCRHSSAFALVLIALTGCATTPMPAKSSAAATSAPAATSTTASKRDPNKVICQTYTPTGSRVQTSQQCYTEEEKEKMDEGTRRAMRDMENTAARPQTSPMNPAGH